MISIRRPRILSKLITAGILLLALTELAAQDVVPLRHRWEVEPGFGDVWNISREPRAKFLDLNDLKSDQAILRFEAAQNICQNYDRPGFRQPQKALELLIGQLENPNNSTLVKRSMISAACLLDDGSNSLAIWKAAKDDPGVRPSVESYLIRNSSTAAREDWRNRLQQADAIPEEIERALDGLAKVGETQDIELCLNVLRSNQSTPITRLAAARALGSLRTSGFETLAQETLRTELPEKHFLAAHLVAEHKQPESLKVLEQVLGQGVAPAKRIAANAIAKNFPQQGLEYAKEWIKQPDDEIRLAALRLLRNAPSTESTRLQAILLGDPDATVRQTARKHLLEAANNGLRLVVDECVSQELAGSTWQGIEQAIVLAVELDDRSRCARLIELLDHQRPEVNMYAGWGLMELANELAIIEALVPHTKELTAKLEAANVLPKQDIIRLSFLFEAFGRNRYEPVVEMLRKYIPKDGFKMGNLSRASAIWALGKILKDQDDPNLRAQLKDRIIDLRTMMPENYLVGFACLLTLGEFGYLDSLPVVEGYTTEAADALNSAGRWAKEQIQKASK